MIIPDDRVLPIPSQHRELTVKAGGQPVPRAHQLLAATVRKEMNRIASARLVYLDGSAAAGDFPLCGAATLAPGSDVEILAGPAAKPVAIFQGVVVRQSIQVREHSSPQLVVECRHKAFRLTVGRRDACYLDEADSDIILRLLKSAGVDGDVESTRPHRQQVQFRSSDWDFLMARAEANGKLVLTNDARVSVKAPPKGGKPVATLQFGATLLEVDIQVEARGQWPGVKGVSWDAAQQALVERKAADPGIAGPGNLSSLDLARAAAAAECELRHPALAEDEVQAWADAAWLKSQLSRVSGRVKCEGLATVNPGDLVTLAGVGARFNGDVLVTGVRHDSDAVQGFKTHVQFGSLDGWFLDPHRSVATAPAGGLLPAIGGLQIGVVTGNEDPDHEHRVRVRLPLVDPAAEGVWARVASLDAGSDRGFFFRPEIDDEVVVGFLDDDPRCPVVLGMLHSSAKPAPLAASDANHEKVYQSRSKMRLYFNDDKKLLSLETPAGNQVLLSEADPAIRITDPSGNKIELSPAGIVIQSSKALTLKAGTVVKLESGTSCEVKGGSDLKLQGASGAELSSSATTQVKGSLVKIN